MLRSPHVVFVKIAEPDVWKPKHLVLWEAANGPVPKKHCIIFADGNKQNFDPDNLLLVSMAEWMVMNSSLLRFPDKEATKTGKLIADLQLLINSRRRELRTARRAAREGKKA